MLCENRPEGFGPSSGLSSPLPTQCFFDTILVPLPAWLLLATLCICPLLFHQTLTQSSRRPTTPRRWVCLAFVSAYYFSIFVVVMMETIEVARLAAAKLGVALIPFVYVGCLIAVAMQITDGVGGRLCGWQVANVVFWVGGIFITAVKVAAVARFVGLGDLLERVGTAYPISDQVTDLAVLVAFYAILAGLEVGMIFIKPGVRKSMDVTRVGSTEMGK